MNLCRHCQAKKASKPRGLCWVCYYTPGLKEHYPSGSKYARRGVSDFNGATETPATPTDAEPGSEEKLCILEERARLGLALFHPRDAQYLPASAAKSQPVTTKIHHAVISVIPYLE